MVKSGSGADVERKIEGLVDTSVLVDLSKNYIPAVEWHQQRGYLGISLIVKAEMIIGAKENRTISLTSLR